MSHVRLFERPWVPKGRPDTLALSISGELTGAVAGDSYEGRLTINNSIGDCVSELVSGELPPGYSISVDNTTKEIVVTWPAYQSAAAPIVNADFEAGDVGWLKGPGWSVTSDNPPAGLLSMQYLDQGGESVLSNTAAADISPGQEITASCSVRQGASSSGNAGAAVRLEFLDASGKVVDYSEGNMIDSASNNEVKVSSVSSVSPQDATSVRVGCRAFRHRQNEKVWVDSFVWNVTRPSVGTNEAPPYGPITIRCRDSIGQEAEWTGLITGDSPFLSAITGSTGTTQSIVCSALHDGVAIFVGNNTSFRRFENGVITTFSPSSELGWPSGNTISNVWNDGAYWWMQVSAANALYARSPTGQGGTWEAMSSTAQSPSARTMASVSGESWGQFAGDSAPNTILRRYPDMLSVNLGAYGRVTAIREIGDYVYIGTEYGVILRGGTVASAVPVFNPGGANSARGVRYISGTPTGRILASQEGITQQAESTDYGETWTIHVGIPGIIIPIGEYLYRTAKEEVSRSTSILGPWEVIDDSFYGNQLSSFAVTDGYAVMSHTQTGLYVYSGDFAANPAPPGTWT